MERFSIGSLVALVTVSLVATHATAQEAGASSSSPTALVPPQATDQADTEDYLALADAPLFLPRNYLYWGTPVGPRGQRQSLIFGLEYAMHLPIFNDVREQMLLGNPWAFALTLSFEGALRMLNTDSQPVRMPSYRPSLSGQVFYAFYLPAPLLLGFRSAIYHYSNGQERCALDEELSDLSPLCISKIESTQDPSASLNRRSGNFSSSGALFELHARIHKLNQKGVAVAHLSAGLAYSTMFRNFLGSMDRATRALHGSGRFEANVEGKRRMGWASLTVRAAVAHYVNDDGRVPSNAGHVETVLAPYWLSGLGLFARYFGGRDFYNAFFVDRLQQFSAGIAWDGEAPLKFKQP